MVPIPLGLRLMKDAMEESFRVSVARLCIIVNGILLYLFHGQLTVIGSPTNGTRHNHDISRAEKNGYWRDIASLAAD